MAALLLGGYLLTGLAFVISFLIGVTRTKQPFQNPDGTTGERRVIQIMHKPVLTGFLMFLFTLWPIAAAMYLSSKPQDSEEDPQNHVPPEYR